MKTFLHAKEAQIEMLSEALFRHIIIDRIDYGYLCTGSGNTCTVDI